MTEQQGEESKHLGLDFAKSYYEAMSLGGVEPQAWLSKDCVWTSGDAGAATQLHVVGKEQINMGGKEFSGRQVELTVVDSQFSVNRSLFVLVYGTVSDVSGTDKPKKKFIQSFYLLKVDDGFTIQNSILRFLLEPVIVGQQRRPTKKQRETAKPKTSPKPVEEPIVEEVVKQEEPVVVEEKPVVPAVDPAPVSRKHNNNNKKKEDKKKEDKKKKQHNNKTKNTAKKVTTTEVVSPTPVENDVVDPAQAQTKPAPKPVAAKPKSFLDAASRAPSRSKSNAKRVPPKPKPVKTAPGDHNHHHHHQNQHHHGKKNGNNQSVVQHHNLDAQCYVSNIPFSATNPGLRKALAKFGPVRNIIRPANKGYGFLQYEKDSDAERAIAETRNPVIMSGRRLNIERRTGKEEHQHQSNRGGAAKGKKHNGGNKKGGKGKKTPN